MSSPHTRVTQFKSDTFGQERAKWEGGGGGRLGGLTSPTFLKFRVFYHKKRNADFHQYPVPQKSNFYRRWRLLKKLYKICTGYYDNNENNEYFVLRYIRYFMLFKKKQWRLPHLTNDSHGPTAIDGK